MSIDKKRVRIGAASVAGLVLALIAGAFAAEGWLPESVLTSAIESVPDLATTASAKIEVGKVPAASPTPQPVQITAELLTITPRGFEPNVVRRPAGRVLLAVVNKTGFPMMTLQLQRVDGTILRTVEMPRNRRRFSIPITLTPGRYRIVDLNRPSIVCNIEITD